MAYAEVTIGSYRDPDGFIFQTENGLFRQVNHSYATTYRHLFSSGLYQELTAAQLLVEHVETELPALTPESWLVIQPHRIPFISYPYEWCFSQLKDAALLTIQLQQKALAQGMSLKDASAYNVQFLHSKPIFIDTLSFELYEEGKPWAAYRQFCEHFLVPLALMAHTDISLNRLLLSNLEGIPLHLGSKLLPWQTYTTFGLLLHVHLHAKAQVKYTAQESGSKIKQKPMSKNALLQLLDSLTSTIKSLSWNPDKTIWADYYQHTNYQTEAMRHKEGVVEQLLQKANAKTIWDLGANTGRFSQIAAKMGSQVIAMDFDIGSTEIHYQQIKEEKNTAVLPLAMDLTQPSPAIGWMNKERESIFTRPKPELIMALALVHHLAISHNLPVSYLASFLAGLANYLIIEFVPKSDSQAQRLLASRKDIFTNYTQAVFEEEFSRFFQVVEKHPLDGTERTLYLMQKR
ncbi:class I SAM-dependent methyltransferase [Rufibacter hautae]|uniref:SAM-dependent methyltransferase n=1 Tax=Rufibacter hautae TaxID=2595005 RepID=A0A5B6TUE8_9BACT|nr:SAM-dependent methyltransferase [Rufibacter hautae]KAA3440178.1 SAM-dependent methyltransferase [Rufibacter hautae]